MRHILLMLMLCVSLHAQKKMAITIDDLPFAYSKILEPAVRDSILIKLADTLDSRDVNVTAFVIGNRLDSSSQLLLDYFATKGNRLGNHTYAHKSANTISASEYFSEVKKCEKVISHLPNFCRYFRYSNLQRGNTKAKRDSIVDMITNFNLTIAPVSIDNEEYVYNKLYVDTLCKGNLKAAEEIAEKYIDYMLEISNSTDSLAKALRGREIKHIMLMHSNLLNSRYLGTLLDRLKADGWTFISLEEALKDPIYKEEDFYVGKWGISWLLRIKQ